MDSPPAPETPPHAPIKADQRVIAGVLALVLGAFGAHKFYLNYTPQGVVMLAVGVLGFFLTCGLATLVMWIVAVAEGITYLTKSDAEFTQTYVAGRRAWF